MPPKLRRGSPPCLPQLKFLFQDKMRIAVASFFFLQIVSRYGILEYDTREGNNRTS
ncbi:MAG: hypothetical protein QG657_4196 [Acidobacteriota bacterium]|nr:hypothetical protein [Acidobacteriota bacterium]